MNDIHGQWYINDLLREFYPEMECFKLIGAEHADMFKEMHKNVIRTAKGKEYVL